MEDALSMHGELRVVEHVPRAFAALVVEEAPASLALSGGSTARKCYELLAGAELDWSEVDVFFGDERWVPVGHPESNEGMARHAFVDQVSPRAVYSMRHAGDTIKEAAASYDRLLRDYGPLGLVHLGLGPDGHTASLFPGSPAIDETERLVVATGDELHPQPRLTFTFPAIARARFVVVTVTGEDKRAAIERIRAGDDLPAARIRGERVLWLGDRAALGGH